jgi:hypothetical protein
MPTYRQGDMFTEFDKQEGPKLLLATTNAVISKDGRLVMGGGAALELREKCPGIDREFAQILVAVMSVSNAPAEFKVPDHQRYGVILSHSHPEYGAFQTKYHHRDPSDLSLIRYSCELLAAGALSRPKTTIFLNYHGIGLGGLIVEEVAPLLETLPDNVWVWRYATK